MNILALDVAATGVKAAVLDTVTAEPVAGIAKAELTLETPAAEASEISAEALWKTVALAARTAMQRVGISGTANDVRGIGLSCASPWLVLLDKKDHVIENIWTHLDRRSRPIARQVWQSVGEEFLLTVGSRPLPGGVSALSYRHRLQADPYLLHEVGSYLHLNGWLAFRMTGEKACDAGNASATGLFNTRSDRTWSPRWCNYFEVDAHWLPPVVPADATVGTLRPEIAHQLGVAAGLPVKIGTSDIASAVIGADIQPGELLHVVDNVQTLAVLKKQPKPRDEVLRFPGLGPHFLHITYNPVGPATLDWLQNLFFRDVPPEIFHRDIVPAAAGRKTRVTFDPPCLFGDPLEIESRRASFRDLEATTDRLDLVTAVLDAMMLRHEEAVRNLGYAEEFRRVIKTDAIHELSLEGIAKSWRD